MDLEVNPKTCLTCGSATSSGKWYRGPVCRRCYSREWRHRTGKTNTKWRQRGLRVTSLRDAAVAIRQAKIKEIAGLAAAGHCIAEISAMLGVPDTTVSRWVRSNGIIVKDGKRVDVEPRVHVTMELVDAEPVGGFYALTCRRCGAQAKKTAADLRHGCAACLSRFRSSEESAIAQALGVPLVKHRLGRKEIDVYVADKKIGIEYCGLAWHSEVFGGKSRWYHRDKMRLAEAEGIRLITVFEDEWLQRRAQVTAYLQAVLGTCAEVIRASACDVVELDCGAAKTFLNTHHIQGSGRSALVAFGLRRHGDLVAVVTGSRHHRGSTGALVLDRLCFRGGVRVHGGASRLVKALAAWARARGFNEMVSWSDNRWSAGTVYASCGFRLDAELPPDYSYTRAQRRRSKQSLKKTPAERLTGKTEWRLRREQGYDRIWDCGKKRWVVDLG
jgi:GNAT superfamily N-acetyltransferase